MKATFQKSDLAHAVAAVQGVVHAQSNLPVLTNLLIRPENEHSVVIAASDLESHARVLVSAEVESQEAATVPARTFADIVRVLPGGEVRMELDGSHVRVFCGETKYDLATMDPDDFPEWPTVAATSTITMTQAALASAIKRVLFAVPVKDPRRVLLGGYFDVNNETVKLVATDGKVFALVTTTAITHTGNGQTTAIVPHKILAEVARVLADEGDVTVEFAERQVAFRVGHAQYVTNVIDGTYPNYSLIIPRDFERTIALPSAALRALVRQAGIVSDEKSKAVIMHFEADELRLSAMTYDIGSYAGSLQVEYDSEPFETVLNHGFLSAILDVLDAETAVMKVNKPTTPVVFCGEGETADSVFIIMPIKVADMASVGSGDDGDDSGSEVE